MALVAAVRLINHNVGTLRAELPDVSINTGVQSINTERASLNAIQHDTT